jgi:hypothetical protein
MYALHMNYSMPYTSPTHALITFAICMYAVLTDVVHIYAISTGMYSVCMYAISMRTACTYVKSTFTIYMYAVILLIMWTEKLIGFYWCTIPPPQTNPQGALVRAQYQHSIPKEMSSFQIKDTMKTDHSDEGRFAIQSLAKTCFATFFYITYQLKSK